jgi:sugar phosphate isomerase/epimerase
MDDILRDLSAMGPGIVLSVELFNPDYYKQDAFTVAKTALEKTRAAVKHSQRSH